MFTSKPKVNDKVLYKICSLNLRRTGEMCARAVHLVISTYIKALCPIIFAYCTEQHKPLIGVLHRCIIHFDCM